jgi:hypothetical protein
MEMEGNNQVQKVEKNLLTYLAEGITKEGKMDIEPIDRVGINIELAKYKSQTGVILFEKLFALPIEQRIFSLAKNDMRGVVTTISVALKLAMESMNLKRPMNETQIVDLAEAIVDTAAEDKIAVEDLMLFLQGLTRGKYGELYDGIDMPKVMNKFDKFRDDRWDEGIRLRDQKHEEYKKLGDDNNFQRYNPKDTSAFGDMMQHYRTKTQVRRDEKRERKSYDR